MKEGCRTSMFNVGSGSRVDVIDMTSASASARASTRVFNSSRLIEKTIKRRKNHM
jgi:hypothetical protein